MGDITWLLFLLLSRSNHVHAAVYLWCMRPILFVLLLNACTITLQAARTERSVVFVHDTDGRPMPGAYATPIAAQAWLSRPSKPAWTVEMHFTVSEEYPYSSHEIGRHRSWPLTPDTVRDGRHRHLRFSILDCWCREQHLFVIQGTDTMRVDMPDDPTVKRHMEMLQVRRSGALPSPEIFGFRPGRFNYVLLAQGSEHHTLEQRIADKLVKQALRVTWKSDRSNEGALLHAPEHLHGTFTSAYQVYPWFLHRYEQHVRCGCGAEEQSPLRIEHPNSTQGFTIGGPDLDATLTRSGKKFPGRTLFHRLRTTDARAVEREGHQHRQRCGHDHAGRALKTRGGHTVVKNA